MNRTFACVLVFLLFAGISGCTGQGKSFVPSIPGYDASLRKTVVLDKELLEISGMFWLENGSIAAINDEDGKVFIVDPEDGDYHTRKFGRKRDYEDIVQLDTFYFVLESNGNIHRVPMNVKKVEEEFEFPRSKRIEFESLYIDTSKQLILVSKEQRESKKGVLAYRFDPVTLTYSDTPVYSIRMKEIKTKLKNNNADFKPSAAAIHPLKQTLFIVASVGKAILETTLDGKVLNAYQLNPDQFPQPEGITFAPNGDMYISNEGVDGKATILKFPYKDPVKKQ
ncbi:hypothetical protein HHL16_02190 [Pseudoflavitalea sp. G-6-1-2]|uniref:SdiA-regulated domain-containing protein n=1 Tax=Pseudoflavitalea sp. G-6-1-2 TaxID=2728841 RepID=UPI00146A2E74|nr:SdiA-regulated domain-containing protein [Pseudoflavitalea sp. G-6-1-2]NML19660.1 hypothetical protein [Pseudoflavitalea sp. G-6-1-2]